ncbi:MAG: DNA translocase FtsK 4TM domain-containing protein [Gemmatimonadota bacterium]|nr:DNA translocase FtsK 4TM domain-containing protein [Gemmatimonadota bacterium]
MDERRRAEALGVGLIALGILLLLAILPPLLRGGEGAQLIGPAGALVHEGLATLFGGSALLVAVPAFAWGLERLGRLQRESAIRWSVFGGGALLCLPGAWWMASGRPPVAESDGAGWLGSSLGGLLVAGFGVVGAWLILVAVLLALVVLAFGWSPFRGVGTAARGATQGAAALGRRAGRMARGARGWTLGRAGDERDGGPWAKGVPRDAAESASPSGSGPGATNGAAAGPERGPDGAAEGRSRPARPARARGNVRQEEQLELAGTGARTRPDLPPLDLLALPTRRGSGIEDAELRRLGQAVVEKLATFRVESRIGGWTTGPVVTQFEVVPAAGVKVGQIAALADDLALALKAPSVRIVAPIPGKGAVGVEVPNPEPEIVHLREILEAPAYGRSRAQLPLALGRDLAGVPYGADLAKMPHLLIAGATGSGKSVCINTIVTSLVYRYSPRELRLLMIDPKMVELIVYNDLPHLRHPVVTDNHDAAAVLRWTAFEMNRRYQLLSANACRNVQEINRRIERGDEIVLPDGWGKGNWDDGPLPYIVLLIDELADLMMTVQSEVETPLAVLAQKARAVGIHLVVATQRPSVNVITGLIKANFPSRIAFRVASKTDSRTILDQNGAESLLGNGDMLFLPPGESDPHRIQGAFLSTSETEALVAWYRERPEAVEAPAADEEADILEEVRELEIEESQADVGDQVLTDWDPYFRKAAEIVIHHAAGSTSLLQRRLKVGYGRAARIVDQLHSAGVLGPPDGSKPREVLVTLDQLDALMRGEDLAGGSDEP